MTDLIRPTACMTFPRSGHHLLQRLLTASLDPDTLVYCEMYRDPMRVLDVDPETNFQKDHDLDLETPVRDDRAHLVQVRYPIESIVSWFDFECARRGVRDDPNEWTGFAVQKASFWMRFYRKWVLDPVPNRLVVNYADLLDAPEPMVGRVVEFLTGAPCNAERVARACRDEGIARRRTTRTFRYYGAGFFTLLRGLFAAVPGVDVERERLVVPDPAAGDDPLRGATPEVIRALRDSAARLETLADDLTQAGLLPAGTVLETV